MEAWILRREAERVKSERHGHGRACPACALPEREPRYALCCSPTQSSAVGAPRSGGPTVRADRAGCAVRALSAPLRAGTAEGGTAEAAVPDAVQQRTQAARRADRAG